MWWPVWVLMTLALTIWAVFAEKYQHGLGLATILVGLGFSQLAAFTPFPWLMLTAIWACVSVALLAQKLYVMTIFAALSAASYFPLWTSFLAADVFGVLMLLSAAGGVYGFAGDSPWRSLFGDMHSSGRNSVHSVAKK